MEKWNILLFKFNNDFSFPVGIYGESQVAFSGITIFFLVGVGDGMVFDADIGLGDVVAFHRTPSLEYSLILWASASRMLMVIFKPLFSSRGKV